MFQNYYLSANKYFIMKPYFLSIAAFCALTVYARWNYVCKMRHHCDEPIAKTETLAKLKNLSLNEGPKALLSDFEQFSFAGSSVEPTLSDDNSAFVEKVAEYLKANPAKNLKITGMMRPGEKDLKSGFYENLGLARAAALRSLLVAKGIPEDNISLDYSTGDEALSASAKFDVINKEVSKKAESAAPTAGAQFTFKNMTFSDANFDSGSDVFRPGKQFEMYADSVVTYLKGNATKGLTITGHTDSDGDDKANQTLGAKRAEAVKKYFATKGVKVKIATNSKGESDPISSNQTDEGKAKNRRVNVQIN